MSEIKVGNGTARQLFKNLWYILVIKYTPADIKILEKKGWVHIRGWLRAPSSWDKNDPLA